MSFLEILSWARKGLLAEKLHFLEMQSKAKERRDDDFVSALQEKVDEIELKESILDEIEEIHNRWV